VSATAEALSPAAESLSPAAEAVREAIADGRIGDRLWLYSNYHCNLTCAYCLTESAPRSPRRLLDPEEMIAAADEAVKLGFGRLGVTGGEPFLIKELPELIAELSRRLPVILNTNATLFTDKLLARVAPLAELPVTFQISLDSADPEANDELRGPRNFAKVVDAIPKLVELGIDLRVATTGDDRSPEEMERLCALHLELGVPEDHHLVRPIVNRGRALPGQMGIHMTSRELQPELTLSAEGAFWSPFAPTVFEGRSDTDLLVSRQRLPLEVPAAAMLSIVDSDPEGPDLSLGIRCG